VTGAGETAPLLAFFLSSLDACQCPDANIALCFTATSKTRPSHEVTCPGIPPDAGAFCGALRFSAPALLLAQGRCNDCDTGEGGVMKKAPQACPD
jgi:hypothetical protein